MTTKTSGKLSAVSPYDVADHLRTPEEINAFLEACNVEACTLDARGSADFLDRALAAAARAKAKHWLI
jgi:DNA-binding phage protein